VCMWVFCWLVEGLSLVVLRFELWASQMWGRHSTTWTTTPILFCSGCFGGRVLHFCLGQPGPRSYFLIPAIPGMTGTHHHTYHFLIEMGSCKLFYMSWPRTSILLISAFQVAWDGRHTIVPIYWLRWGFVNFFSWGLN
jgi:hypothetical protein